MIWHNANEEKPLKYEEVLCYKKNGRYVVAYYDNGWETRVESESCFACVDDVVYWARIEPKIDYYEA